jgi:acetolactate synthase-1/2/3 large subunit
LSKYSDDFMEWLVEAGYTHCFFVAGGNVMHLLESAGRRFNCTPFINEIGAAIAADAFNEICQESDRAFVLVTAGPGLTNVTTSVASSWVDRRELLIIGGQAKSSDLARGKVRQKGFQEICGVEILKPITKKSILVDSQISKSELFSYLNLTKQHPKGPVFLEICLDVSMQETKVFSDFIESSTGNEEISKRNQIPELVEIVRLIKNSSRPLLLIGGGVDRNTNIEIIDKLKQLGLPLATTFNGADRVGADYEFYCGRPNWYGSRWANLIVQQSDLVVAIGARLGLMDTGYNWEQYVPNGKIIQVDVEESELKLEFPNLEISVATNPNSFITALCEELINFDSSNIEIWQEYIRKIRTDLAQPEIINVARANYVEYYTFIYELMKILKNTDIINPCSSGGNFESFGRIALSKTGQKWVTCPGLASMGFGISGGIGMSLAYPNLRTIVLEGDGGLAQNLQELSVIRNLKSNIKIFIADNGNYGSIKSHQKSTFNNNYIGCDKQTGLWLPDWVSIGKSFDLPTFTIDKIDMFESDFLNLFESVGPAIFIVKVDPDQIFYPKISSSRDSSGKVVSNPLHEMEPKLTTEQKREYLSYLID